MNEERMRYWSEALIRRAPLEEISDEEINLVVERDEVYYVSGLVAGSKDIEFTEDEVFRMGNVVRHNIVLELLRRRYAPTRPKLFPLRDMVVNDLHEPVDVPEREFLLGLAYTYRQKTGKEITAEEAEEKIDSLL